MMKADAGDIPVFAADEASLGVYLVDGRGGAQRIPWEAIPPELPQEGFVWLHLDRTKPSHQNWLRKHSGIDPILIEALLEEETRPRLVTTNDEILAILRGVNLNENVGEDLMISLRAHCQRNRMITLRRYRLYSVMDIRDDLLKGVGPKSTGDFLVEVARHLVDRQSVVIEDLADSVDEIEERILEAENRDLRSRIAAFRRKAIGLRRYIAPQRDVLSRLAQDGTTFLTNGQRARVREVSEAQLRMVEELDSARDRAAVAQEELSGRLADQMNRNMYLLSIIAGIFLPLGLLTGLLGINVGGMPGVEDERAFTIVCVGLVIMAAGVLWLFRRLKLI